jgi:hypothetical protein
MEGKRKPRRITPEDQAAFDERTRFINDVIAQFGERKPRPRRRGVLRFLRRA